VFITLESLFMSSQYYNNLERFSSHRKIRTLFTPTLAGRQVQLLTHINWTLIWRNKGCSWGGEHAATVGPHRRT
jgi:hypothetical protein